MIRIVDITHMLVVPFHNVMFHTVVAVVREISVCLWWVHVSQHVNFLSVSQTSSSHHPYVTPFQFLFFCSKVMGHISSVGPHCPERIYFTSVQVFKKSWRLKKLSINILCPKTSTLLDKCLSSCMCCSHVINGGV